MYQSASTVRLSTSGSVAKLLLYKRKKPPSAHQSCVVFRIYRVKVFRKQFIQC